MLRVLSGRIRALLLLPLLLLLCGAGPGSWHCADGSPCETASALACCCGCPETEAGIIHHCVDGQHEQLVAETCGCYYETHAPDAQPSTAQLLAGSAAALPAAPFELAAPGRTGIGYARPAVTESPPPHLIAPRDTRGPPLA